MASAAVSLPMVPLDDKSQAQSGRVYLSGIQALIRLPMMLSLGAPPALPPPTH